MTPKPSFERPPPVVFIGAASSAMDAAWEAARAGSIPFFGSILAESQTAGRGRRGRPWSSPPGHVYAAMRLPPSPPFSGPQASLAAALFLARALERLSPGLAVSIKWPNDLMALGGKVGGILLESRGSETIAGIGLNLGSPPPIPQRAPWAPPAGALPESLGPPRRLWPEVAKYFFSDYNENFGQAVSDWPKTLTSLAEPRLLGLNGLAAVVNPSTTPKTSDSEIRGRIAGLDPSGGLVIETAAKRLTVWSGTLILGGFPAQGALAGQEPD